MARPVGIAAAGPRLCQESSVSGALVHAGGPGTLTSWPAPTHKAVALSLDTHTSARARGVQAVHCTEGFKRESVLETVHLLLPLCLNIPLKLKLHLPICPCFSLRGRTEKTRSTISRHKETMIHSYCMNLDTNKLNAECKPQKRCTFIKYKPF